MIMDNLNVTKIISNVRLKTIDKSIVFKLPGFLSFIRLEMHILLNDNGLTIRIQGKHLITIDKKDLID